jgi:hypothetical protein
MIQLFLYLSWLLVAASYVQKSKLMKSEPPRHKAHFKQTAAYT